MYLGSDRCSSVSLRTVTFIGQVAFSGEYLDLFWSGSVRMGSVVVGESSRF